MSYIRHVRTLTHWNGPAAGAATGELSVWANKSSFTAGRPAAIASVMAPVAPAAPADARIKPAAMAPAVAEAET